MAEKKQKPHKQPRDRNKDDSWRKAHSDYFVPRRKRSKDSSEPQGSTVQGVTKEQALDIVSPSEPPQEKEEE